MRIAGEPPVTNTAGWNIFPLFSTKEMWNLGMPLKNQLRTAWRCYTENISTLQASSISRNSSGKETVIAGAGKSGKSRNERLSSRILHPSSTRKEHRGAAEGIEHLWSSAQVTFPEKAPAQFPLISWEWRTQALIQFSQLTLIFFHKVKSLTTKSQMNSVPNMAGMDPGAIQ